VLPGTHTFILKIPALPTHNCNVLQVLDSNLNIQTRKRTENESTALACWLELEFKIVQLFHVSAHVLHGPLFSKSKKNILVFARYIILLLSKIRTIFLGINRAIYSYVLKSIFKTNLLSIQWHSKTCHAVMVTTSYECHERLDFGGRAGGRESS